MGLNVASNRNTHRRRRWLQGACLLLLGLGLLLGLRLMSAKQAPIDAVLVLGGSIRREIYVAEVQWPDTRPPILISQGSPDPCIRRVFERSGSSSANVLLEKCAQSTFDNFVLALPILHRWRARHIQVVTSAAHLPRARWMAQIILGSHGIWPEIEIVPETGVPGNLETPWKTLLDMTRSLAWVLASPLYQPRCQHLVPLADVDLAHWAQQGYQCERQGGLLEVP